MKDEIKEFSRDEVSGTIFQATPFQVVPAQQSAASVAPAAGPVVPPKLTMPYKGKASVGLPDPTQLVETVSKANKALKENAPAPEAPSAIGGLVDQILNNWKPIAFTAAATYGATKAAPIVSRNINSAYNKIKNIGSGNKFEPIKIEPTFATEQEMNQAAAKQVNLAPIQQTNLTAEDLRAKLASMQEAPAAIRDFGPNIPPQMTLGAVSPANVPPSPPYQPVATPLTAAPGAPAPAPSAAPGSPVTGIVADTVKELIDETPSAASLQPVEPPPLQTGTGKPAFAGQGPAPEIRAKGKKAGEPMLRNSYARVEDVPAGYAFVPGAQNIDTSRTNIGQAEYTKAYSQRPFPLTNEAAMLESSEINRMLGRPTRAEAKAAGITLPAQTPGITKAVLESKESPFMGTKAAKVGGVLGALVAIPNLVHAAEQGKYGEAALQGADIATDYMPIISQIKQALMPSSVGAGSTLPSNITELQRQSMLLGSPYAQSDIAKRIRQDQEYTRKVGAGRGIAPPSAYKR